MFLNKTLLLAISIANFFLPVPYVDSFAPDGSMKAPRIRPATKATSTQINFLWFGNKDEKESKMEKKNDPAKQSTKMGTTATTMENFKQSQEVGRKTSALLVDLSSTTVEGSAAKGKIKVLVDGQQKPLGVEIDDDYFDTVGVEDLTEKLATAMQDAHDKSTKLMQEKMESLYAEIGLPPNKGV
mmetsp:Transcript_29392/g.44862  ORF Transcript_29392/g.44862 Transcript_29392/m.44862 type:complete len:184 (-) Transcript_29392:212-763(-)|eukprot:CAMPEP_0194117810 /NCGR_PEP_ID=MMETSP0150-20130528/32876_1 /TAXON_ID=122233 /ORGANISM="Chaetoceros debilis, Strain MM31A-1" /LENGTH=183 /DNA_ID=CAMNT_0038808965 /DNA_START=1 /DNA_END=552 /DNA_ORIENTATION=+